MKNTFSDFYVFRYDLKKINSPKDTPCSETFFCLHFLFSDIVDFVHNSQQYKSPKKRR